MQIEGEGEGPIIDYVMYPTLAAFHNCDDHVRCVIGPVGSGKSTGMVLEGGLLRARKQEPDKNGVRRTRGVIIRNTYNELTTTTLKTFKEWFKSPICTYRADKPISARVKFPLPDNTIVDCEIFFLACDKAEDIGKLLSMEITWAYINEASEISDYQIVEAVLERIGRYPKANYKYDQFNRKILKPDGSPVIIGGPTWSGLFMDTNPPDDEHWIYNMFEVKKEKGWRLFKQPPAVFLKEGTTPENPEYEVNIGQRKGIPMAENLPFVEGWKDGVPGRYYLSMIPGMTYERVSVMLMCHYGTIAYGRPVYPEYSDHIHYLPNYDDPKTGNKKDVEVYGGLPLLLGFDFGLRFAACVIAQLSNQGQLRVIEESVVQDIGTRQFALNVILPLLHNRYTGMPFISRGDPAGNQRKSTDATTDIDILNECGIPTVACPTNSPKARREAVVYFLTKFVGEEPGLVIGSHCPMIRKGFAGRYYYKKVSTSSREELFNAEPVKNKYSHPADALQYIACSLVMNPDMADKAMKPVSMASLRIDDGRSLDAKPDLGGIY